MLAPRVTPKLEPSTRTRPNGCRPWTTARGGRVPVSHAGWYVNLLSCNGLYTSFAAGPQAILFFSCYRTKHRDPPKYRTCISCHRCRDMGSMVILRGSEDRVWLRGTYLSEVSPISSTCTTGLYAYRATFRGGKTNRQIARARVVGTNSEVIYSDESLPRDVS